MAVHAKVSPRPGNRIRETGFDLVFSLMNYGVLALILLLILYPLVYVVSASLSDGAAVISGRVVL